MPRNMQKLSGKVRSARLRRYRRDASALTEKYTADNVTVVDDATLKRAAGGASLGNMMEWFDYGVYGYLAVTMSAVFFDSLSDSLALVATFGTFAISFLIRPLGGMFFGPLGDKIGRQSVLATTMIMMALGTVAIGFIPVSMVPGWAAVLMLIGARLIQGFAAGGEYAGAMTFTAEYAPDNKRGHWGSFLDSGTYLGFALGAGLVALLNATLGQDTMEDWGWRLPFWCAGILGVVGLYLRLKLEDSPAFQEAMDEAEARDEDLSDGQKTGLGVLLRDHRREFLVLLGIVAVYNVLSYTLTSFMNTYLTEFAEHKTTVFESDMLVLVSILITVFSAHPFGILSDRIGRRPILIASSVALVVTAFPVFALLQSGNMVLIFLGCAVLALNLGGFAGPVAATLPAIFPTFTRMAALGIGYNLSVAVFGGTTPMINSALIPVFGTWWPAIWLVIFGVVGLVSVRFLPESARQPLVGNSPQAESETHAVGVARTLERMRRSLHLRRRDRVGYEDWDESWDRWPDAAAEAGLDADDIDAAVGVGVAVGEATIDELTPDDVAGTRERETERVTAS
ncbi:MFS transporter [Corynebacterium variabile]|uniref:MFS transporter n=1 Tax=Corynebacterium variabile TaxID=1727 RepID=UPI0028977DCC|nr:MFS transporter [Corynebacterium variabile]